MLLLGRSEEPWQSVTPTIEVSSADEYATKIEAAGGTIVQAKTLIPGIGHSVTFRDTEGNVFALLELVREETLSIGEKTKLTNAQTRRGSRFAAVDACQFLQVWASVFLTVWQEFGR